MSDVGGPPSDEELLAHFGPGGPVPAAKEWLELVKVDGDIASAWPLTDPNLRLVLVQNLMWDNLDRSTPRQVLDQI